MTNSHKNIINPFLESATLFIMTFPEIVESKDLLWGRTCAVDNVRRTCQKKRNTWQTVWNTNFTWKGSSQFPKMSQLFWHGICSALEYGQEIARLTLSHGAYVLTFQTPHAERVLRLKKLDHKLRKMGHAWPHAGRFVELQGTWLSRVSGSWPFLFSPTSLFARVWPARDVASCPPGVSQKMDYKWLYNYMPILGDGHQSLNIW